MQDGYVESAMRDGGVEQRDGRGLMPLDEARAMVRGAREFRKGQARMVGGTSVLDSDRLWAALMSLEDADEFVREATRLRWYFHPRDQDNVGALERYGEAILPWLASFVRPDGRFVNVPWCVRPCLMALGREDVFDLLWKVTSVSDGIGDEWPGPFAADNPGDADRRSGTKIDEPGAAAADDDANGLVIEWLYGHPEVGFPALARKARTDARARRMLKSLAQCGPGEVFEPVREALGEEEARAIFAGAGAPTELDEGCILATLDAAAAEGAWPQLFGAEPALAYHAMRLVAVRGEGDGWGILFERVEGAEPGEAYLRPYCFGSSTGSGPREVEEGLPFGADEEERAPASPFDLDGVTVEGPEGTLELSSAMNEALDLRPGWGTAAGMTSSRFSLMLRAYLAVHPDAFWGDPEEAPALLGLGGHTEVVVVSTAFQHCVGGAGPEAYPPEWKAKPSASPVLRSLARAIVAGDGSLFEPGAPDLDFRLHALAPIEEERGGEA